MWLLRLESWVNVASHISHLKLETESDDPWLWELSWKWTGKDSRWASGMGTDKPDSPLCCAGASVLRKPPWSRNLHRAVSDVRVLLPSESQSAPVLSSWLCWWQSKPGSTGSSFSCTLKLHPEVTSFAAPCTAAWAVCFSEFSHAGAPSGHSAVEAWFSFPLSLSVLFFPSAGFSTTSTSSFTSDKSGRPGDPFSTGPSTLRMVSIFSASRCIGCKLVTASLLPSVAASWASLLLTRPPPLPVELPVASLPLSSSSRLQLNCWPNLGNRAPCFLDCAQLSVSSGHLKNRKTCQMIPQQKHTTQ